jgi:hypothetical protein
VDEELTPHLQCDVELQITAPNDATLNKWAADALRRAADMIESGKLTDGFHDVTDKTGKKLGTVYVDYSEGDVFEA